VAGASCSCKSNYQATAYSRREGRLLRKHFANFAEAKTWREDANQAIRAGKLKAPVEVTLGEALTAYIDGMKDGTILDRSGKPYKPATCHSYERAATLRIVPEIGHGQLADIRRRDLQDFTDRLHAAGLSASTVHNTINPLRAVYRRALRRDLVVIDPTDGLELPAVRGHRDRTAAPAEAEALIEALPASEQALWAMAIYIGARRGELQELRWDDIDREAGIGRIERAWDNESHCVVDVKTEAGERLFPIIEPVRRRLIAHRLATGRSGSNLVFGRTATERFTPTTVRTRALEAWGWKRVPNPNSDRPRMVWVKAREDALEPITLHEGRHSAATAGSSAGLDDLALAHIMGHSSVVITRDRYGHVRPDRVAEVGRQLDAYYERAASE